MDLADKTRLDAFLKTLGLSERPMGLFYSSEEPQQGISPTPMETPTREKERYCKKGGRGFPGQKPGKQCSCWDIAAEPAAGSIHRF
jgi:hypothetical protein